MSRLWRKLRAPLSEPYRIRQGYGLSPIRTQRELRALKDFCLGQLKEKHIQEFNPQQKQVYESTVDIINKEKTDSIGPGTYLELCDCHEVPYWNSQNFIDDHVGHYWS